MKRASLLLLTLLSAALSSNAQKSRGTVVKAAQTATRLHLVHVLVCTQPGARDPGPQLRVVLVCNENGGPNCVQPFAGTAGYMEDLDRDLVYEGHNVRVEWLDGGDGTHNQVGAYQVQSTSAEKCDVK